VEGCYGNGTEELAPLCGQGVRPKPQVHEQRGNTKGAILLAAPNCDVEDESDRDLWCELQGNKGYIALKQAHVAKK